VSTALQLTQRMRTFHGGVHPDDHKAATCALPIERMPFVERYVLPLTQHIGSPSRPIVKVGDDVVRGQTIAEPEGFVSVALHAPVTGRVMAIDLRLHPNGTMVPSIEIATDPYSSQRFAHADPVDPASLTADEMLARIQNGGLVGLGGAAFPSHVKLRVPEGRRVRAVVINGCECEPYLTCDHRLMLERSEAVLRGAQLLAAQVGSEAVYVGVEANKPDAIAALRRVAAPHTMVVPLAVKYPQGAEKLLIDAIFGQEVPTGGLPLDIGILVNSVGTSVALANLFDEGIPLTERVVTITGPAVARPRNVLVPLGTPLRALLDHCGGLLPQANQVVLGGPMMGMAQKSLDVPVLKGTSGLLCLDRSAPAPAVELPCIRCGRCIEVCPMLLNPARLAQLAKADRFEEMEELYHLTSCFECASCSFVCPSQIPLVQWIRVGKTMLRKRRSS